MRLVAARLLVVEDDLARTPTLTAPQADPPPLLVEIDPGDWNDEATAAVFAVDQAPGPATATKGARISLEVLDCMAAASRCRHAATIGSGLHTPS